MGLLVTVDDFVGYYKVAKNQFNEDDLNFAIDDNEESYLKLVLGDDLGKLFIADIDATTKLPVTQKYLNIYNKLFDSNENESKGIKDMILCFIYFEFRKNNITVNTPTGTINTKVENAINVNAGSDMVIRYNRAIASGIAIQNYITDNYSDYPDFTRKELRYEYFL